MTIDPAYTSDALIWLFVWAGAGLTARNLLARADQRRQDRHTDNGKAVR